MLTTPSILIPVAKVNSSEFIVMFAMLMLGVVFFNSRRLVDFVHDFVAFIGVVVVIVVRVLPIPQVRLSLFPAIRLASVN